MERDGIAPAYASAVSRTSLIALSAADVQGRGVAMQLAATNSIGAGTEADPAL